MKEMDKIDTPYQIPDREGESEDDAKAPGARAEGEDGKVADAEAPSALVNLIDTLPEEARPTNKLKVGQRSYTIDGIGVWVDRSNYYVYKARVQPPDCSPINAKGGITIGWKGDPHKAWQTALIARGEAS